MPRGWGRACRSLLHTGASAPWAAQGAAYHFGMMRLPISGSAQSWRPRQSRSSLGCVGQWVFIPPRNPTSWPTLPPCPWFPAHRDGTILVVPKPVVMHWAAPADGDADRGTEVEWFGPVKRAWPGPSWRCRTASPCTIPSIVSSRNWIRHHRGLLCTLGAVDGFGAPESGRVGGWQDGPPFPRHRPGVPLLHPERCLVPREHGHPGAARDTGAGGCIVTIDAMGCRKRRVQTIRDRGVGHVPVLKGNPPSLHAAGAEALPSNRRRASRTA